MLVLSHRGCAADHPENTLAAFEAAVRKGAHGIETDVRLTSDGRAVLFHDRVAPGGEPVASLTHAALSRDAGYPVPTLAEALRAFPAPLWMLEVKAPEAAEAIEKVFAALPAPPRAMVTSFHHGVALRLSERLKIEGGVVVAHSPLSPDAMPFGLPARAGRLAAIVWAFETVDVVAIRRTNAAGYRSFVYGVETTEEHEQCLTVPLAGVVTDHPEYILDLPR